MVTRVREFAKTLDHTLLRPEASEADVRRLCREAAYYHFAAVCVLPCHIRLASRELRRTDVKVASVVTFPFGGDTTLGKAAASRDMKRLVVQIVAASGADFVKTSTGFGPGGATVEDASLLREEAPEGPAIKASGGIRSLDRRPGSSGCRDVKAWSE
ncbi:MAG: hypothetical protein M3305_00435 [Actinomycetota bacterium]|nr:hypothetical protein [Actinomycetota bacterium]